MKRAVITVFMLCAIPTAVWAGSNGEPISWLNRTRAKAGLAALGVDEVLERTATAYAEELAALGRISHRGPDGSDALTRYLRMGGTAARVGEILGAGDGIDDIERAWLESEDHQAVIFEPYWTHAGYGMARVAGKEVWVVLFVQRRVEGLVVEETGDGGMRIEGALLPTDVAAPILLSGIVRFAPVSWDPATRRFLFILAMEARSGYVRLGYISESGELVITDVITSPRGTGSPEGESRSASPG